MIGDTRTAALVASDGSIDWWCVPRFDGEPLLGRLVGGADAGTFRLGPAGPGEVTDRRYRHETATLTTTWKTPTGHLLLSEAMVADVAGQLLPSTLLVRRLTAVGGPAEVVIDFDPRLGEHHSKPLNEQRGEVLVCSWDTIAVAVTSCPPVRIEPGRVTTVTIEPDEHLTIAISVADHEPLIYVDADHAWNLLVTDEELWRHWCVDINHDLPYRDVVVRSLITLRLLTYSPSGAPVAAPTTSLPEDPGGVRNWDYRFAWPRDASIGIAAFLGVGKVNEARHFLAWLLHASRVDRPRLPVLLTLHGRRPAPERRLEDWPGYADSRPVRVGNGAADQHQLDGYGWVLDAAWRLTAAGHHLYSETWRALRGFANEVAGRWQDPDAGIWEIRGDAAHHVHSKLMAWLTLDRALRISLSHRTPARHIRRWRVTRAAIAAEVTALGFDNDLGSYTRTYGSADLDAALLILPAIGLYRADSDQVRGTISAVRLALSAGGPLLYRYPPGDDGLPGSEGAFLPCSFWLVEALASTGDIAEARRLFEDLIARGGDLLLFPEEMDPATGAYLGNFPQSLSHAGLVQAALALHAASPDA